MKSIILAAGKGNRLEKYTKNLPKGMLNFNGKTLLEWQISTIKDSGIKDIIIVTGYKSEKINFRGIKYYKNYDFKNTNMVVSLMAVEKEFNDDLIISYSDILYEKRNLKKLIESKYDISVLVDDCWKDYWKDRMKNWKNDIESLKYDNNDNIFDIGNPNCKINEMKSRYIGLIKFSKYGITKFKETFYENKKKFWHINAPWMRSKSFKKAYMTCMLQALINKGTKVKAIHTDNGWMEFDTVEDYEKACLWIKNKYIHKYIKLE